MLYTCITVFQVVKNRMKRFLTIVNQFCGNNRLYVEMRVEIKRYQINKLCVNNILTGCGI